MGRVQPLLFDPTVRPSAFPLQFAYPQLFLRDVTDPSDGALDLRFVDALIPDDTQPLVITREYRSSNAYSGVFGRGWSSNLDVRAERDADGDWILHEADGRVTLYRRDGSEVGAAFLPSRLEIHGDNSLSRRWNDGTHEDFDASGRLVYAGDDTAAMRLAYDGASRIPSSVSDSRGRHITIAAAGGRITGLQDPLGRRSIFAYAADALQETRDALGRSALFQYGPQGMSSAALSGGAVIAFSYARDGSVSGVNDANKLIASYTRQRDAANGTLQLGFAIGKGAPTIVRVAPALLGSDPGLQFQMLNGASRGAAVTMMPEKISLTDPRGSFATIAADNSVTMSDETPPSFQSDEWRSRLAPASIVANSSDIRYDAAGRPVEITLPGLHEFWQWDAGDRLVAWSAGNGATTSYAYDSANNLTAQRRGTAERSRYEYDGAEQLTLAHAPNGDIRYAHNDRGQIVRESGTGGNFSIAYDGSGRIREVKTPSGTNRYVYDELGRVIGESVGGLLRAYTYDPNGRVSEVDASDGTSIVYAYGVNTRTATAYLFGQPVATQRFTQDGKLLSSQSGDSDRSFEYDVRGRLVKSSEDGIETTYAYDDAGRVTRISSGSRAVEYRYDAAGELAAIADPTGTTQVATLPAGGRRFHYHGAAGDATVDEDLLGRETRETTPNGTTHYTYAPDGRLAAAGLPAGTLTYQYNGARLAVLSWDGSGTHATVRIDDSARSHAITYEDGTRDEITRDENGRVQSHTDRLGRTQRYRYDRDGLIQATTGGQSSIYRYDSNGRPLAIGLPDHTNLAVSYNDTESSLTTTDPLGHKTTLQFDAAGDLIALADAAGNVQRIERNADGSLKSFTDPLGKVWKPGSAGASAAGPAALPEFSFDALGRLVRYQAAPHASYRVGYDVAGRPQRLSIEGGPTVRYSYDAHGQVSEIAGLGNVKVSYRGGHPVRMLYSNGVLEERRYQNNRIVEVTHSRGGSRIFTQRYRYDADGNTIESTINGVRTAYTYDVLSRLTTAGRKGAAIERYDYDAAGNPKNIRAGSPPSAQGQTFDSLGSLTAWNQDGKRWYRLPYGNGALAAYEENALQRAAAPGPEGTWVALKTPAGIFTPVRSPLGTLLAVVDQHGRIVQRFDYTAYGDPRSSGQDVTDPEFAGASYDRSSGVYRFGARAYSPSRLQFLTPDATFGRDGNLYTYAYDNPLRFIDTSGATGFDPAATQKLPALNFPGNAQAQSRWDAIRSVRGGNALGPDWNQVVVHNLQDIAQGSPSYGARQVARQTLDALGNGSSFGVYGTNPGSRAYGSVWPDDPKYAYIWRDNIFNRTQGAQNQVTELVTTGVHEITHTTQNLQSANPLGNEWEAYLNEWIIQKGEGAGKITDKSLFDLRQKVLKDFPEYKGNITADDMWNSMRKYIPPEREGSYVFADVENNIAKLKLLREQDAINAARGGGAAAVEDSGIISQALAKAGGSEAGLIASADAKLAAALTRGENLLGTLLHYAPKSLPYIGALAGVLTADNHADQAWAIGSLNPVIGSIYLLKSAIDLSAAGGKYIGNAAADAYIRMRNHFLNPFDKLVAQMNAMDNDTRRKYNKRRGYGSGEAQPPDNYFDPPAPEPSATASAEPSAPLPPPQGGQQQMDPCLVGTWRSGPWKYGSTHTGYAGVVMTFTSDGLATEDFSSASPMVAPYKGWYSMTASGKLTSQVSTRQGVFLSVRQLSSNAVVTKHYAGQDTALNAPGGPTGFELATQQRYKVTLHQLTGIGLSAVWTRTSEPPSGDVCAEDENNTATPAGEPSAQALASPSQSSAPIATTSPEAPATAQANPTAAPTEFNGLPPPSLAPPPEQTPPPTEAPSVQPMPTQAPPPPPTAPPTPDTSYKSAAYTAAASSYAEPSTPKVTSRDVTPNRPGASAPGEGGLWAKATKKLDYVGNLIFGGKK